MNKWDILKTWLEGDRKPMERLGRAEYDTITCMRACMGYSWAIDDILAKMDALDNE